MGVSVEISMYPLSEAYKALILDFAERLRQRASIEVYTNNMSTRIFGQYDEVMPILTAELRQSFEQPNAIAVVMKIVNRNFEE